MNEQLQAIWSAKITSLEQFKDAIRASNAHGEFDRYRCYADSGNGNYANNVSTPQGNYFGVSVQHTEENEWPLWRDIAREYVGVYPPPSNVIRWLRLRHGMAGQFYPHVSKEDPTKVAFTPDHQSGIADNKVRTSMGKMLRKFLPLLTDAQIAALEGKHRAELDTTFKLAETVEDIERVYLNMEGDSGCMRYSRGHFDLIDYHPSAVYCSPGMGVAYIEDEDGTVKARSVVWVNPADPTDKRFVRVYGDQVLIRKLEMNGYVCAGLAGAKLTALYDSSFEDHDSPSGSYDYYVMPYMDPPGGGNSGLSLHRAFSAVRYKGDDFLTLLDRETYDKLVMANVSMPGINTQSGHVAVPTVNLAQFTVTCGLTGETFSKLENQVRAYLNDDGVIVDARADAVMALSGLRTLTTYDTPHGDYKRVHATAENRLKYGIPGFLDYINDKPTRSHLGVVQLDSEFYPGEPVYVGSSSTADIGDDEPRYVRREDALFVMPAEDATFYTHNTKLRELRAQGYLTMRSTGGIKRLVHKDHPQLVVTANGTKAVIGQSDITMTHDGVWDYNRNLTTFSALGKTWLVRRGHPAELSRESIQKLYATELAHYNPDALERYVTARLLKGHSGQPAFYMAGDEKPVASNFYHKGSLEQMRKAIAWIIAANEAQTLAEDMGYLAPYALLWARASKTFLECFDEQRLGMKYGQAEAEALDWTNPDEANAYLAAKEQAKADALARAQELVSNEMRSLTISPWPLGGSISANIIRNSDIVRMTSIA